MKKVIVILLFLLLLIFPLFVKADDEYELNELEEGIYFNSNLPISQEEYEYNILNIEYKNDCYVIVGSVLDDNLTVDHLEDYVTYPYIAYYNKYGKVWSTIDKTAGHGEYKDAVILDNEIVAIGSFETSDDYSQMLISKFNLNGNVNSRYKTSANKSTYGSNIYYENNYYYVVGLTNATDLGGECNEAYQKIYVMKLDKDFNFVAISYINNSSISLINDVAFGNESLFIYCTLSGTGNFTFGATSDLIVNVDKDMTIKNYLNYVTLADVKITALEDGVAVVSYSDTTDSIKINKYNNNLIYVNSVMPFDKSYDLISLSFNNYNYSNLLLTCTIDDHDDVYNEVKRIDKGLTTLDNAKVIVDNYDMLVSNCYYDNGYYYFFGIKNYWFGKKMMYVHADEDECYFNGIKGEKTLSPLDTSVYGKHYQTVTYNYKDITIKTTKEVNVPLKTSIVDKGKYDRMVTLEFNGNGYLNNEKISSGYVVDKIGTYVLEVRGIGLTTYFVFEITNLSIKEESYEGAVITITEDEIKDLPIIDDGNSGNNRVKESYNLKELDNINTINNSYFYIIIFVIIGISLGLIIPLERIGKKNV